MQAVRPAVKPFDGSNVFLFTPAPAYRIHYQPLIGRPDQPEYPAGGRAHRLLPREPVGRSEARDPRRRRHGRAQLLERSARAAAGGRGGGRRGGGLPSTLPIKAGMNRFVWDLRYAGAAAAGGDGEGGGFGGGGPLVAPGVFKARLTAGGVTRTEPFTVKIDPRIAKDGVTVARSRRADQVRVEGARRVGRSARVQARVRQAIEAKRGDQAKLQTVWDRLTTKSGPYEDQMFIDQLSNVNREIGEADQRVGASAFERFNQLMKEWTALKADAETALR